MWTNTDLRVIFTLLVCLLGASDAYKQDSGLSPKAQLKHNLVGTSQNLYNASFQQPLFRVPPVIGPASAITGGMNPRSLARFVRRDTCETLQNCASLTNGGKGKCCGPSDASWCCGESDECGTGDGNYCVPHKDTCADLGNCVTLSDGTSGRCCTGSDGAGDWCCGNDYLCGDGVNENYCSWVVTTTTLVVTGTTTITTTDETTVTEPGDTKWTTVTSTSIEVVTVPSADVATKITFVTQTAAARRARNVGQPKATKTALTVLEKRSPLITKSPTPIKRNNKQMRERAVIESTVTETSTNYITQTETEEATSTEKASVTSTSTSTFVSTITSVLNAKTTTTVTSTITQPPAATGQVNTEGQPSNPPSGSGNGGSDTRTEKDNDSGLSTGAKAGIGAGAGLGALLAFAIIGFLWRRHRKNKQEDRQTLINDTLAAAAAQYGSPHPASAPHPMTDTGSSKFVYNGGTITQTPVTYSHELPSNPVPQQSNPRSPSPRMADGQRMHRYESPTETYHQTPVEVAAVHSPRPQAAQPSRVNNMSDMDEWRR